MKTTILRSAKSSDSYSTKPFFNKNKKGSFLSNSIKNENPFFTSSKVQAKLKNKNSNLENKEGKETNTMNITQRTPSYPLIQRKFAGTDGKKVDMHEKAGKILITSKNASSDLTELIKLVNESGSKTAVIQVLKASNNLSNIHVKIESKEIDNNLYGLHQAHDNKGKALNWDRKKGDFDGIPEYVGGENGKNVYKEATITIFKGNLKKDGGNESSHKSAGVRLTLEQLIAGTFSHETGHNTDKEFIGDLRKRREGKENEGIDPHKNIKPLDDQVYKEIGEYERSKNDKKEDAKEEVK